MQAKILRKLGVQEEEFKGGKPQMNTDKDLTMEDQEKQRQVVTSDIAWKRR